MSHMSRRCKPLLQDKWSQNEDVRLWEEQATYWIHNALVSLSWASLLDKLGKEVTKFYSSFISTNLESGWGHKKWGKSLCIIIFLFQILGKNSNQFYACKVHGKWWIYWSRCRDLEVIFASQNWSSSIEVGITHVNNKSVKNWIHIDFPWFFGVM